MLSSASPLGAVLTNASVYAACKNLPPFTLRLAEGFVNGKTTVSTGFFVFLPVFAGFLPESAGFEPF
ncbi:MAG TPA: hypothetical protein VKU93_06790 [Terracidiphilus sp.]|nr:hypothetical protein [Terracidiphilus sp.]